MPFQYLTLFYISDSKKNSTMKFWDELLANECSWDSVWKLFSGVYSLAREHYRRTTNNGIMCWSRPGATSRPGQINRSRFIFTRFLYRKCAGLWPRGCSPICLRAFLMRLRKIICLGILSKKQMIFISGSNEVDFNHRTDSLSSFEN